MPRTRIADPFVIIPLWLVERASPEALKLYAVLYAHEAYQNPRKTIAKAEIARRMGAAIRTVDRYLNELLELKAVEMESGRDGGAANTYVLLALSPERATSQIADPPQTTDVTDCRPPRQPAADPYIENARVPSPLKEKSRETPYIPLEPFEEFWKIYPRATGYGEAQQAFENAVRGSTTRGRVRQPTDPAVILEGARRFAADPNLPIDEPTYIPLPTTWLNQDRWRDGPLPARGGRDRGPIDKARILRLMKGDP